MKAVAPSTPASTASTHDNLVSLLLISLGTRTCFQTVPARAGRAGQAAVNRAMERSGIGSQPGRCRASYPAS
ncbi:hypothetical protein MOKP106_38710 [Mycobacterium avium subsp. hominissuis]